MWIIAFIGAGTAFAESSLAQVYKLKIDGEYKGGPAYYIERGTGVKVFALIFAFAAVLANGITGPTIQAFNFAEAAHNAFGLNPWIAGVVMAVCVALVAFGGSKRLGRVSELIVPVMAIIYIILALIILCINFKRIPEMFGLIFGCAFNMNAFYGAIWGSAVMWGVKRGIYSNEAGYGLRRSRGGGGRGFPPGEAGTGSVLLRICGHPLRLHRYGYHDPVHRHVQYHQ